jgi:hypothetical protein
MDPHVVLLMGMASGAGWLMMKAGISKKALEPKRKRARCPSCGRHDACICK